MEITKYGDNMNKKRVKTFLVSVFLILCVLCVRIATIQYNCEKVFSRFSYNDKTGEKILYQKRGKILSKNLIPLSYDEFSLSLLGDDFFKTDTPIGNKVRKYSPVLRHTLGYVGADSTGLCALEKMMDEKIKEKEKTTLIYEKDSLSMPIDKGKMYVKETKSTPKDIVTTIDYHIQKEVESVMDIHIKKGAVVIMDVENFEILAISSNPSYEVYNIGSMVNGDASPLLNRAISAYNAGSVFKIVTLSAYLEKNPYGIYDTFYCTGELFTPSGDSFKCNNLLGHQFFDVKDALSKSCNFAFYKIGEKVSAKEISDMALKFGFGKTHLGFQNEESKGFIPQKEVYAPNEVYNLSIGQGDILITPLSCTLMTTIIASGGVKKDVSIIKDETKKKAQYVISPQNADFIKEGMRKCAKDGTGKTDGFKDFKIASKTGSAESGWFLDGELLTHGWYTGFFPYDNPKYAMTVFCENGKSGKLSCVNAFNMICEKINEIYPFL